MEGGRVEGQSAPPTGINHLLVIAIDDYLHCPKLNNCIKDAKDLIEVLDSKYGISIENKVLPPLFNNEATKENITLSFRKLAEKVSPEDNVLIYFSGHGEYDSIFKQGYWIPVEGEKGKVNTYLPNSEVRVFLEAIKSRHTFLMVDSCFSGALFMNKSTGKNLRRSEQDPSRWGLTSGRNEIVSDGEAGKNSPFAESLLYRLRHNTKSLGVDELCAHVREYVEANSNQSPIGEPLRVQGHKNGLFVFNPKLENEDNVWAETLKSNTTSSYKTFLLRFPKGIHADDARSRVKALEEEVQWEAVKATDTISIIIDFLDNFPNGRYKKEAMQRLDSLEDIQDWEKANRSGRISDFLDYKDRHPNGRFLKNADQGISELRDKHKETDAWRRAQNENTAISYQLYLEEYPNGVNSGKAKEELEALKQIQIAIDKQRKEAEETSFWSNVKSRDDLQAYDQYLNRYPSGLYKMDAEQRKATLKKAALQEETALEDKKSWEQAKKENTITSYRRYLNLGFKLFRADAKKAIADLQKTESKQKDEVLWQEAVKKNNKQGYQDYLNAGYTLHRREAEEKIDSIEKNLIIEEAKAKDRKAWGQALKSNTITAYHGYLDAGYKLFKADAEKAIATLKKTEAIQKDETTWHKAVKENSKEGFQEYIRAGHTLHRKEAEQKVEALSKVFLLEELKAKDRKAWGQALQSNTIDSYRGYLDSGNKLFKDDAEKAIASLQKITARQRSQQRKDNKTIQKAKEFNKSLNHKQLIVSIGLLLGLIFSDLIKKSIQEKPINLQVNKYLENASIFIETGFPNEARMLLDSALKIKPDDPGIKTIQEKTGKNFTMVFVNGGTFNMGCTKEQEPCEEDEKPVHQVTVSDFYISKYEVTVRQFKEFVDNTGYQTDADRFGGTYFWEGDSLKMKPGINWKFDEYFNLRPYSEYNYPVMHVSWNDAFEFCKWISKKKGQNFRLPTEAEWEYAARGGVSKNADKYAGMYGNRIERVGMATPNELGLYDMSRNVNEWCSDWYDLYKGIAQINPKGPNQGYRKVFRGADKIAHRGWGTLNYRNYSIGFRLALTP